MVHPKPYVMTNQEARQKDIDDGIWCESYRSHEGNDWCVKGHVTCMGKLCMDYRYDLNTLLRCNGCLKLRIPKIEKLSCLNCARMKIDYFLQDISEPLGRGVDE